MAILEQLSKFSSLNVATNWMNDDDYPANYCQKFSTDDIIRVQGVLSSGNPFVEEPTFSLVNIGTDEVRVITPIYYPHEEGKQIVNYVIQDASNGIELTAGDYYVSLYDVTNEQEILNINFKVFEADDEELLNTVRIRYSNNYNEFDYHFLENDGAYEFTDFRIEAKRNYAQDIFNNQSNYFRNQEYYQRLLSSYPYTQEAILFGETTGSPYWVGEKLNFIFSLQYVHITFTGDERTTETIQYERSEGATLEIEQKENGYPLFNFAILVERIENRYGQLLWNYGGDDPLEDGFKFTVNITTARTLALPITLLENDVLVDWGDGEFGTYPSPPSHTYSQAGTYQIRIAHEFRWSIGAAGSAGTINSALVSVDEWGNSRFGLFSTYAFYNCVNLKTLPIDSQNLRTDTSLQSFLRNTGVETVPADLFRYNPQITDAVNVFYQSSQFKTIPTDLFRYNVNITSFGGTFANTAIDSIPASLFSYNTLVTTFVGVFQDCKSFASIPSGLFNNNTRVTNFERSFNGCSSLTAIPTDLFRYNTIVTSFLKTFQGCLRLASLPNDLFRYNTLVTTFNATFELCNISSINANLFQYNTRVVDFYRTFLDCANLSSIPQLLFRYNVNAVDCRFCFARCTSITTIPTDLFRYNVAVLYFNGIFQGCTSLNSVPANLFSYNINLIQAGNIFQDCTSLTTVPVTLFGTNNSLTRIDDLFNGCTALTNIPAGIFDNCPNITTIDNLFYRCMALTSIPNNLFINNTKITYFSDAFRDTGITSESPVDTNGTKLWQRGTVNTQYATPIFFNRCFSRSTNMADWQYIPTAWGGGGQVREIQVNDMITIPAIAGTSQYSIDHIYDVEITH